MWWLSTSSPAYTTRNDLPHRPQGFTQVFLFNPSSKTGVIEIGMHEHEYSLSSGVWMPVAGELVEPEDERVLEAEDAYSLTGSHFYLIDHKPRIEEVNWHLQKQVVVAPVAPRGLEAERP